MAAGDTRFSRFGVEVLGKSPPARLHVSRFGVEVLGKIPDAKNRVSRFGVEVVGQRPAVRTQLSRFGAEVLGKIPDPHAQLTRFGIEVLGRRDAVRTRLSRFGVEILGSPSQARTRLSRFAIEVLGDRDLQNRMSRYGVEVLGEPRKRTLFSRFGVELLGRRRFRMIPNPLPAVLANIFSHNWAAIAKLESAYLTDVTSAGSSLAEERRGLVDRPYRTLTARFVGFTQSEALRLTMNLARHSHQRMPVPLFTDHSRVTQDSSGTDLWCNTLYRRFFQNGRVLVHKWTEDGRPTTIEYAQIDQIEDDRLILTGALSTTFPKGSRVYPLLEAEINLEGALQMINDQAVDLELTVLEVVGRSALPSTTTGNPPGFPTWNDRPIFDVPLDWSANIKSSVFREGYKFQSGRAEVVYVAGTRPQFQHEMRMTLLDRERAWKVVRFFDSRLGRLRSFYMVHPGALLEPRSLLTTEVRVAPAGNIEDLQEFMAYVAIVKRDGTIYVRAVEDVTEDSGDWVIDFGSVIPSTDLDDVRKVTPAYLVRLKDDAMLEEWSTDETCSITLTGIEVLDDSDQELTDTEVVFDGPAPVQVDDLYYWAMPSRYTFADTGRAAAAGPGAEPDDVGASVALWDDARETPAGVYAEGATAPGHILYSNPAKNNGRPTLQFSGVAGKWKLRPLGADFFDNAEGLTVFVAYRPGASPGTYTAFLKKAGVLEWGPTVCKMFETLDGEVADNNITFSNLITGNLNQNVVALLTWDPGAYARVYKNGVLQGSAVTPVTDLPAELTREADFWSMQSQIDANDLLIYKRALSTAELNQVGQYLANVYKSTWSTIT